MPRHRLSERYNLPSAAPAAPRLQPFPQYPDYQGQQLRDNLLNQKVDQIPLQNDMLEAKAARAQSQEAQARYKLQKEVETDRQKAAFYNGLQELESSLNQRGLKIGSREHAEAFAAYAHEFPLARSSSDVQQALKIHALVADDQAALKQRINALQPPPEKIAQRYSKVQGDIAGFSVDSSKSNDLNAALVESDQLEKMYPQLKVPSLPQQTVFTDETPTPAPQGVQVAPGYGTPAQTTAEAPVYTPSPSPESTAPTVDHSAAISWATANPNDPRAQVILSRAQAAMPPSPTPDEGQ